MEFCFTPLTFSLALLGFIGGLVTAVGFISLPFVIRYLVKNYKIVEKSNDQPRPSSVEVNGDPKGNGNGSKILLFVLGFGGMLAIALAIALVATRI